MGKIFHLVDVQWPLLAYKALCAFRCDADGYLASSPSERCRVQNYVLGVVCLLVFVIPVPIILGGQFGASTSCAAACTRRMCRRCLAGRSDLRRRRSSGSPRLAQRQREKVFYLYWLRWLR